MDDNEIQEEGGLIDRIKESPRTVSALIIILIVAAAIYAFSGDEGGQVSDLENEQQQGEEIAEVTEESSENSEAIEGEEEVTIANKETEGKIAEETDEPKVAAATTTTKPKVAKVQEPLPEPHRTEKGFVEVAEAGNGITHLARRASSRWLSENQAGYAVTDEHRIYIEDYIQNRTESNGLALGDTVEIGFDLIQEAVTAAEKLNENQLNNLSQYTHVLQ